VIYRYFTIAISAPDVDEARRRGKMIAWPLHFHLLAALGLIRRLLRQSRLQDKLFHLPLVFLRRRQRQ